MVRPSGMVIALYNGGETDHFDLSERSKRGNYEIDQHKTNVSSISFGIGHIIWNEPDCRCAILSQLQ